MLIFVLKIFFPICEPFLIFSSRIIGLPMIRYGRFGNLVTWWRGTSPT